jgi:hypothetical protein
MIPFAAGSKSWRLLLPPAAEIIIPSTAAVQSSPAEHTAMELEPYVLLTTAVDSTMRGMIMQALDKTRWQAGKRPTVAAVRARLRKYRPRIEATVTNLLRDGVFGTDASVSTSEENMAKIGAAMDEILKLGTWQDIWSYVMFFRGCEGPESGAYGSNIVAISTCELGICGHNHEEKM